MKKLLCVTAALSLGLLALAPAGTQAPDELILEGGRIVDGTGAPWFLADVAVRDGRIVAVGSLAGRPAKRRIDARGLIV
ncbi:MAG: D-aminoacylase, partial [Thermoanaerobaculia bacterium]